jgi:hypothetical protein
MDTREYLLNETRAKIAEVDNLFSAYGDFGITPADVRRVAVILGSSRSGSSFLFSQLARSGGFWSPQGEDTPFARLEHLGWVDSAQDSDAFDGPTVAVSERLLRDVGRENGNKRLPDFARRAASRLLWQWPHKNLDPRQLWTWFLKGSSWSEVVYRLQLNENWYDHATAIPSELPDVVFEEPPLVESSYRASPTKKDLKSGVLLLKTSSNAYRLPWLRRLFPNAEYRWIVLSRNPAAGINGLIDGWHSHAFHSHNVGAFQPLAISGYADRSWWKFDLPPGWPEYVSAELPAVCAFQWRSAYQRILSFAETTTDPVLRVKYEDLIRVRQGTLQKIFAFTQTDGTYPESAPPIMATLPPTLARWRYRRDEILPQLLDPRVEALAAQMHYDVRELGGFV